MIMADVLKVFLLILGVYLIFISHWMVAQGLFPRMVRGAREEYDRPFRILGVGLLVTAVFVLPALPLMSLPHPVLKMVGMGLASIPVFMGFVGSAGLCQRIGAGLQEGAPGRGVGALTLKGGILLGLTYLLPFVGWFVLSLGSLITGVGAVWCVRKKHHRELSRGRSVEDHVDKEEKVEEALV